MPRLESPEVSEKSVARSGARRSFTATKLGFWRLRKLARCAIAISRDLYRTLGFARDRRSALRIGADLAFFRLLGVLWKPSDKIRRVRIRPDTRLSYRQNKGDIYLIHEVWFEGIYRLPVALSPGLLIDLGANIGMASLWLAIQYGYQHVIAVEPCAGNVAVARENLESNGIKAQVIEAAVGASDGTAEFFEVFSSTNGRLKCSRDKSSAQPAGVRKLVTVRVVSMDTVLRSLPAETLIDLLKIDIEGGEQALFSGDVSWLARVKALLIEFHPSLIEYDHLVATIESYGLRRVHSVVTDASGGNTLELFLQET